MLAIIDTVRENDELLTLPQAADALHISHVTLWRLAKAGRIAVVQIGRVRGIYRSDLEAFAAIKRKGGRPRKPPTP